MKLAKTRGKVGGRSGVDVGLTSLLHVGSEFVNSAGRGVVGMLEGPEGFLLQSFNVQQNQYYC